MWYVIQVITRHEEDIVEKCRERVLLPGEEAFVFYVERERKLRGEWVTIRKPAFPGYVFLDTEDSDSIRIRLRSIKEMTKVLSFGSEVLPVYEEEKRFLLGISDESRMIRKSFGYREGSKVVITEGSLRGYETRIVWIDRHKRECGVEMLLMGEKRTLKLSLEVVTKLDEKGLSA